jgi:AraC-like DNA-binding protein
MQHVEILDNEHFEKNYYRVKPPKALAHLIDFYWQTKFEYLWDKFPQGFSDALFPNIGYTYLINLGTPFIMQVGRKKFNMKTDGFLPRHQNIECFHQAGNCLFGIKFKVSPIIFEKKINFSEYTEAIFPLSYLMEKQVLDNIKQAGSFAERTALLNTYYSAIVKKFEGSVLPVTIVSEIIDKCSAGGSFNEPIEEMAEKYAISSRTLQRYFEKCTGLSTKKTLQILRIRKAVEQMAGDPAHFDYTWYGYYDYSHFYKHLQQFLDKSVLQKILKNTREPL